MFIRRHVHGARGVVEDQDLRLLHNGARNAQALLLSAGEVRGVLLQNGLIAVREAIDEFVWQAMAQASRSCSCVALALPPAEILRDRAGEQRAVLQHHGNAVAQVLERVIAHIAAADAHGAGQRVIKARDEIHKRGFALAGAADDADGLTAVDMYGDVAQ